MKKSIALKGVDIQALIGAGDTGQTILRQTLQKSKLPIRIVGLIDDCKNISAFIRVTIYIITSGISLYLIGGIESISINEYNLSASSMMVRGSINPQPNVKDYSVKYQKL